MLSTIPPRRSRFRIAAALLLLGGLAVHVAHAASPNTESYLENADFSAGTHVPEGGWKGGWNPVGKAQLVRDTTNFKTGPASIRLESVGGLAQAGSGTNFKSVPKGPVMIRGFVKSTGTFKQAQISLQSLGDGFKQIRFDVLADAQNAPDWKEFSTRWEPPEGCIYVNFGISLEGEGKIWLDDVRIEELSGGAASIRPDFDPAAEARPVGLTPAKLAAVKPYRFDNVFVGGGGTVIQFAQHPKDPNFVTIGADVAGVFKRDAKDERWIATSDSFGPATAGYYYLDALALDPSNPDVLYYAAGQQWVQPHDVLKSTDRGETWKPTGLKTAEGKPPYMTNSRSGERFAVDPHDGRVLLYGSRQDGLFRSTDAAGTWQVVKDFPVAGHPAKGTGIGFVLFDAKQGAAGKPSPNAWVLVQDATTQAKTSDKIAAGVYRTTDAGATWTLVPNTPAGLQNGRLDRDGTLYVTGDNGFYRCQDPKNGTWEDLTPDKKKITTRLPSRRLIPA